jgi:hypothetical protein
MTNAKHISSKYNFPLSLDKYFIRLLQLAQQESQPLVDWVTMMYAPAVPLVIRVRPYR